MTRIIAGAAGSLRLEVPKSGTRPTSDRVREAVFSTLGSWEMIEGSRVLDLYAGSGALGLEAASRGASSVTLVERHPQAAQVASRNVRTVAKALAGGAKSGLGEARSEVGGDVKGEHGGDAKRGPGYETTSEHISEPAARHAELSELPELTVARQSVRSYIESAGSTRVFDVVFIDPPYDLGEAELAADLAALVPLLADDAVVMVERSSRTPEPTWSVGLERIKEKRYGETVLWWAERAA